MMEFPHCVVLLCVLLSIGPFKHVMNKIGSNVDKIEIEIQNSTYLFSSLKFGLMEYSFGTVKSSLSFIPLSSGFFQFGCCLSNNVLKKQKKN